MIAGYGLQYTMPFQSRRLKGETEGRIYRVQFYRRGFAKSVVELKAGTTPWEEETDDELFRVKAKAIKIGVLAETVDLSSFYADNDREVLVELQKEQGNNFVTVSTGWLTPYDAKEPYKKRPYPIELSATCGLGSLQDFPLYKFPTLRAYPEPITIHELLFNCLAWVGYPLPLRTWTGRYETSMLVNGEAPGPTFDPLLYVKVNPRRWLKEDGTYESCLTVLDDLCELFGAVLVQQRGVWTFQSLGAYTSPQQYHHYETSITALPQLLQEANRYYSNGSNEIVWESVGTIGQIAPKKIIKVEYGYGEQTNLLINGDFSSGFSGWDVFQDPGKEVESVGTGEVDNPFGFRIRGQSPPGEILESEVVNGGDLVYYEPNVAQYIEIKRPPRVIQSQGRGNGKTYTLSDAQRLRFTGIFVNQNVAGAKLSVEIIFNNERGYYLTQEGKWKRATTDTHCLIYPNTWVVGGVNGSVEAKPTEGVKFEIVTEPVPQTGDYLVLIGLFAGEPIWPSPTSGLRWIEYRDFRLSVENEEFIPIAGERWTTKLNNTPTDRQRKEELSIVIGDQLSVTGYTPQATRYGALLRVDGKTPTTSWLYNNRKDRIQKLCAWDRLRWLNGKRRKAEGTIILQKPFTEDPGPLSIIHLGDLPTEFIGIPQRWSWNVIKRSVQTTLVELPVNLTGDTSRGTYETPDGDFVPIVEPNDITLPIPIPVDHVPSRPGKSRGPVGGYTPGSQLKNINWDAIRKLTMQLRAIPIDTNTP